MVTVLILTLLFICFDDILIYFPTRYFKIADYSILEDIFMTLLTADMKSMSNSAPSAITVSYASYMGGSSKKIDIPNGRVGVIIGKGGETIKYLQLQSGAKIQVTRDMDADPNSPTRTVELMGTPEQIAKAEQLINEVLEEVGL